MAGTRTVTSSSPYNSSFFLIENCTSRSTRGRCFVSRCHIHVFILNDPYASTSQLDILRPFVSSNSNWGTTIPHKHFVIGSFYNFFNRFTRPKNTNTAKRTATLSYDWTISQPDVKADLGENWKAGEESFP